MRLIHVPSFSIRISGEENTSTKGRNGKRTIRMIETPGLNNSTGQRLWDCAIALSYWLSRDSDRLRFPAPSTLSIQKSRRIDDYTGANAAGSSNRRLQIVELGGGLALVSLVASFLLNSATTPSSRIDVVSTDIPETVATTLSQNLEANFHSSTPVRALPLSWGSHSPTDLRSLLSVDGIPGEWPDITLLASDVLYNPSSHKLFLQTIQSFSVIAREHSSLLQAFIGYKPRTEGDDAFWELAKQQGMQVELVWRFGKIEIWKLSE